MDIEQIKQRIEQGLPEAHAEVEGDGHHFFAKVVSPAFEGQSLLARHRMVKDLFPEIKTGELHALSVVRADTPEQAQ